MPGKKKSDKSLSPWILHVKSTYAAMKAKNPSATFKAAMCAAANCWDEEAKSKYARGQLIHHPCKKSCKPWTDSDERRPPVSQK